MFVIKIMSGGITKYLDWGWEYPAGMMPRKAEKFVDNPEDVERQTFKTREDAMGLCNQINEEQRIYAEVFNWKDHERGWAEVVPVESVK